MVGRIELWPAAGAGIRGDDRPAGGDPHPVDPQVAQIVNRGRGPLRAAVQQLGVVLDDRRDARLRRLRRAVVVTAAGEGGKRQYGEERSGGAHRVHANAWTRGYAEPMSLAVLDGVLMDASEAFVPVTDEGLLRGDGVFEVIPLYRGRPFGLDEHLARMGRSAEGLRLPLDVDAVRGDIATMLAAIEPADAALRVLVTRGGHRVALIEPRRKLPATMRLATITYSPTRLLDGIKSLSYGANMLATRLAKEQGADEALLVTPHGRVLEGPTLSFFYVLDGQLYTPPLSDRILDSITRRMLFEIVDVSERVTTRDDLSAISEAFLSSSTHEAQPISAIDDIELAAPGPLSLDAAERARKHIEAALAR